MSETIKVEIEIPKPPEGFKFAGLIQAMEGDFYLVGTYWKNWTLPVPSSNLLLVSKKAKQYREPVLPADEGKICEFCDDDKNWHQAFFAKLGGYRFGCWLTNDCVEYNHCRIEVSE
jgi:hypothetical protein